MADIFKGKSVKVPGSGFAATEKCEYNLGIFTAAMPKGTQSDTQTFDVAFRGKTPRFAELRNIGTSKKTGEDYNLPVNDENGNATYKASYRVAVTNDKGTSELWLDIHYFSKLRNVGGKLQITGKLTRSEETAKFPWLSFGGVTPGTLDETNAWLEANEELITGTKGVLGQMNAEKKNK